MIKKISNFVLVLSFMLELSSCFPDQISPSPVYIAPSSPVISPPISVTETQNPESTVISPTATEEFLKLDSSQRLAFSVNAPLQSGIYTFSPLLKDPNLVTKSIYGQAFYSSPSWSPEGNQIAFRLSNAYTSQISIVNIDMKESHLLTQEPLEQRDPSWSPNGKQIVFVSKSNLYIIDSNGSNLHLLAAGIKPLFPTWSPDGKNIAFLSYDGGDGNDYQLHIIDKNGKNVRTPTNRTASYSRISWSPDGNRIAFGVVDPCWDIVVLDLLTSNILQLTDTPGLERDPAWSPDGKYIAYAYAPFSTCEPIPFRNAVNGPFDLYLMSKDGGQGKQLTFFNEGASQPVWWPTAILQANWKYSVTQAGSNLNVRESPTASAKSLLKLQQGEVFTALDGPDDADNYQWWRIRTNDGTDGWIADVPGWYMFNSAP